MINLREKKGKSKMKKILIIALIHFLFSINLFANEKNVKKNILNGLKECNITNAFLILKKLKASLL